MISQHDPMLDPRVGLTPDSPVVSDEYLDALTEKYVASALLARETGFDGVDIKACHRYLILELLASLPGRENTAGALRTAAACEAHERSRRRFALQLGR